MEEKLVVIKSRDRQSGETVYDFTVNFNDPLPGGKRCKLTSCTIPCNVLVINDYNNTFYFRENGFGPVPAILTNGVYDITTFPVAVKTAMDTASSAARTYTVSISSTTNKMTITGSSGTFQLYMRDPSVSNAMTNEDLIRRMGFSAATSTALSQTGDMQVYLAPPPSVLIQISNVDSSSLMTSQRDNYANPSASFYVPLGVSSYDFSKYSENTEFLQVREMLGGQQKNIRIRLLTSDGYPLVLQNDWEMSLSISKW